MSRTIDDKFSPERVDWSLDSTFSNRAIYFREYKGRKPKSDWNGKPIVGPPRRPFAELQMVERLERDGWTAGWCYKSGQFISSWEPSRTEADFPAPARELLKDIAAKAGARAGCWDVFAWKDGAPRFVELKRGGSTDRIRASQLRWREAAEAIGVPSSAFLELEWLAVTSSRVLKNAFPAFLNSRLRKARLSLRSRNQAHRNVHDFAGPSVARTQAVETRFSTAC